MLLYLILSLSTFKIEKFLSKVTKTNIGTIAVAKTGIDTKKQNYLSQCNEQLLIKWLKATEGQIANPLDLSEPNLSALAASLHFVTGHNQPIQKVHDLILELGKVSDPNQVHNKLNELLLINDLVTPTIVADLGLQSVRRPFNLFPECSVLERLQRMDHELEAN